MQLNIFIGRWRWDQIPWRIIYRRGKTYILKWSNIREGKIVCEKND